MAKTNVLLLIKDLDQSIIRVMMKKKNIKTHPSPTQIRIIHYMIEHTGEVIYQKSIENYLGLSRATVSDVLNTMEKNGMIKRIIDEEDTRTKKVILNDIALQRHKEAERHMKSINEVIQQEISKEELNIFMKVIKKMKNNLDTIID